MISLLTNLEVQLFDTERVSQIHCARYDLPNVIERFKQEALVQVLQQPFVKDGVYVFRDTIHLEFLAAGKRRKAQGFIPSILIVSRGNLPSK